MDITTHKNEIKYLIGKISTEVRTSLEESWGWEPNW